MKKLLIHILFMLLTVAVLAQEDTTALTPLQQYEQQLLALGDSMLDGRTEEVRIAAVKEYIPLLVKSLQEEGSFEYPFDSLRFMKKLVPEDEAFALYNWTLKLDDGTYRYYGALQMNTDSFVLFPLFDLSKNIDTLLEDTVLTHRNWFGAQYYQVVGTKHRRQRYYTLLGWDGHTEMSNKKIIDVLTFDDQGNPVFGAPIFQTEEGQVKKRLVFEFSNRAVMMLNYLPDYELITYDWLVPPNAQAEGQYFTYIPSGSYDYLRWKKGRWQQEEELFENSGRRIKMEDDPK